LNRLKPAGFFPPVGIMVSVVFPELDGVQSDESAWERLRSCFSLFSRVIRPVSPSSQFDGQARGKQPEGMGQFLSLPNALVLGSIAPEGIGR